MNTENKNYYLNFSDILLVHTLLNEDDVRVYKYSQETTGVNNNDLYSFDYFE